MAQARAYTEFSFYWEDELWIRYMEQPNFVQIVTDLLQGMDAASHDYVQMHIHLLKLLPYKEHILLEKNYGWTRKDAEDATLAENLVSTQNIKMKDAFMYATCYGMRDLPQDVLARVNGTCVVDGGAYIGDTLLLFNTLFPESRIFAFEPYQMAFDNLKENIQLFKLTGKVISVCRGLSNTEEELPIYAAEGLDAGATCNSSAVYDKVLKGVIKTTTIDAVFKNMDAPVGLIKLDIEGLEMKALEGAKHTIQKYKPIIVAAMYHRPEDFFELRKHIEAIQPGYRFMVRRSEMVLPVSDLVLIAY